MEKPFSLLAMVLLAACTVKSQSSENSKVAGNVISSPKPKVCELRFPPPGPKVNRVPQKRPTDTLLELKTKIRAHGDINKSEQYMETVLNMLTSRCVMFSDSCASNPEEMITLVPYYAHCCETAAQQKDLKQDFQACINRAVDRVLPSVTPLERDLLNLGKGVLMELSPAGRQGWCQHIEGQWYKS